MTCASSRPCTCGCCRPVGRATPLPLWNRPGLERLDYRVGTYESFRRSMLEGIAARPELARWTARNPEDYGIAVISMWAWIGDVLTFYGERAAHEAFLRTAVRDRSLRRLAAMLDYLPDPGSAATASLAYAAEPGKSFHVRPGLRVQSVPGQDEKPQKFEPVETVAVDPALATLRGLPVPTALDPLAVGSSAATLKPMAAAPRWDLAAGDRLVAVTGDVVEDKELAAVEPPSGPLADWRTVIRWKPALQADAAGLYKWRRKMRLFGHNAPVPWLQPTASGGNVTFAAVDPGDAGYPIAVTGTLPLDGVYDVAAGGWVLVRAANGSTVHQVVGTATVNRQVGPLAGAVTELTVDPPVHEPDLRTILVYELVEVVPGQAEIPLWDRGYAAQIAAGASVVAARPASLGALAGIEKGRRLVLADGLGAAHAATAAGPPAEVVHDGVTHLEIAFSPPLAAPLDAATAVVLGNVAEATHGETVAAEVLGSGDASQAFQAFPLAKHPVTHVPDPAARTGAASTLEVRVDGVRWHEVRDFYGRAPDERVFVARLDETGRTTVRFGDGRTGARVHTGRNNVVATYRHGLGLAGRVAAGTLRTALDRPVGLKSVTNPAPAFGGADPERGDAVRENAPNRVRTFDRVVSLADFEDAAREYTGVAKARAVERWEGEEQGVFLFVAGDGGGLLGPDGLAALRAWLDQRRDPHRRLTVADHRPVPVVVVLDVAVDPDHAGETVQAAVADALAAHFAFERRGLGEPVAQSDLYAEVQAVPGVLGVDLDALMFKAPAALPHLDRRSLRFTGAVPDALQPRLLLFGDELAVLEAPAADVTVNLGIPEAGA
ncbi:MAG TPA: putative baseplate assembly protein [Thermoanaerobaculia bacterium]|nr:putative baseplate assembly protein [Thermoanaerobaculia bacterium]